MPEETDAESSDANLEGTPPGPLPRVGAAFAGETTGTFSELNPPSSSSADDSALEETVFAPAGGSSNEVIGDYEILGKLGQGGMGAVYRARQISLHRQVALKVLPATLEADAEFVTRFQREARMAASLNHQNIVKVYASGQADGAHFIAMELVEGETLGQYVKRGKLEPADALRITRDVALALQCGWNTAHLIHRDIKPGNIFLSETGEVKVGDLGLAKSMTGDTSGLTQTGTAMGTPHYISPEQSRGDKDIDFRADIYSLGCTLYQMLTGRTPYTGADPAIVISMHRDAPPPAILKVLPQCPIPLARLVGKMLKKIKRERQASYEELIAEIDKVRAIFVPEEEASSLSSILPPDPEATMLETPVPDSTRSRVPTAATVVLANKPKSKLPLYGGIAAAVAIAAGVAVFALRPAKAPEKLSKAEIAMREREAAEKTNPPTTAAAMPAAIRLTDSAEKIHLSEGVSWENGVLHLKKHGHTFDKLKSRDGILRASVRTEEGCGMSLRFADAPQMPGKFMAYALRLRPKFQVVDLAYNSGNLSGNDSKVLQSWPLPATYRPEEWTRLELRAVGDELTVSVNGTVLGTVHDGTHSGAGTVDLYSSNCDFRDVEYVPLDGGAAAAGSTDAAWQPLFSQAQWERAVDHRELKDGLLHFANFSVMQREGLSPDGRLRARITYRQGTVQPSLLVRASVSGNYKFQGEPDGKSLSLKYYAANHPEGELLGTYPLPAAWSEGETFTLELRAVGERLTASYNGAVVIEAVDGRNKDSRLWGIYAKEAWFQSAEFAPVEGSATFLVNSPGAQRLFTKAEWEGSGDRREYKDGLVHLTDYAAWSRPLISADGSLRARIVQREGSAGASLMARTTSKQGSYKLQTTYAGDVIELNYYPPEKGAQGEKIAAYALPTALRPGDTYTLELDVQGDKLTGLYNDAPVIAAVDGRIKSPGDWGIYAKEGWFEAVEYSPLNGAPTAAPAKESAGWQPLFTPAEWQSSGDRREFKDGLVQVTGFGKWQKTVSSPNGALRARIQYRDGSDVALCARASGEGDYKLQSEREMKDLTLRRYYSTAGKQTLVMARYHLPVPLKEGDSFTLELRLDGEKLTGLYNGAVVVEAVDAGVKEAGKWGVNANEGWFESVEYLPPSDDTKLRTTGPAGEAWQPLVDRAEWERTVDERREYKEGLVHLTGFGNIARIPASPDGALRARIQFREGSIPVLSARNITPDGSYVLQIDRRGADLNLKYYPPGNGTTAEILATRTLATR